ncbi:MAG: DNA mismatch repair endonuclease MutL [Anaerolineales bacterium]|nr:DNA mismatch repair endonuclease MutL [Anaerolineales bacterium]
MSKIQILPEKLANQIAAGEVVERPASVVKELLENAIDAKASHIAVIVEGAGKKLIEVADDGCGIPVNELPIAITRHATSKISETTDLFDIHTLGFRGEALASIGSVSRFTITSRTNDASVGARLRVDGGHAENPQSVGTPVGTVVRVEDLFFNVPARLKFLKSDITERRRIDNLVTRYALAYPEVRFHLHQDGRPVLQTSGNGDRREVLAALYGADIARQMLKVLAKGDDQKVIGFVSPTSLTRSNRRGITFFINGRPVQDAALTTAVVQAYHTLLMVGRYPLAMLLLELPTVEVDVNVHPTKAEVRFRDPKRVFSGVQHSVRRALLAHTQVPEMEDAVHWMQPVLDTDSSKRPEHGWGFPSEKDRGLDGSDGHLPEANQSDPTTSLDVSRPSISGLATPILRLVGQVATTFLVAEGPDGLYLIDQHAAHERVLFEKFMSQREDSIPAQVLLQPVTVELPSSSARLLADQLPVLERLGFQVEPFGPGTFIVRAIPTLLLGMDPTSALGVLVEDFEEDESPLGAEVEAKVIARVCKRAAVRAGQVLSHEEQEALLSDLEACESPRTCPHGRPTMIYLSVDLLERQFGRKGAR